MHAVLNSWPVQAAKARFSEMLETTIKQGPQLVTKHGRAAAVLVPVQQWEAMQAGTRPNLKQWLLDRTGPFNLNIPPRGRLKLRKV